MIAAIINPVLNSGSTPFQSNHHIPRRQTFRFVTVLSLLTDKTNLQMQRRFHAGILPEWQLVVIHRSVITRQ